MVMFVWKEENNEKETGAGPYYLNKLSLDSAAWRGQTDWSILVDHLRRTIYQMLWRNFAVMDVGIFESRFSTALYGGWVGRPPGLKNLCKFFL